MASFNVQMFDDLPGGEYAMDILVYMQEREKRYLLLDYMNFQPNINRTTRTILVNWMVEVQEKFALHHETIYLAVKLLDYFLIKKIIQKKELQLISTTALLIASKFKDYLPPTAKELVYISGGAFKMEMLHHSEKRILKELKFDINIPTAYEFLRPYAMCSHCNMETLTLARFICELTVLNYDFVQERASRLACACILLALKMKKLGGWNPVLECVSGYKAQELFPLVKKLNFMLTYRHKKKLSAVHKKYSDQVFFEVARIPPIDMLELEEELKP